MTDPKLTDIKNAVCRKYPGSKVYLYGSRAKGKHTKNSDYDICVLVNTDTVDRRDFELQNNLSLDLQEKISIVFCTQSNEWCHTLIN